MTYLQPLGRGASLKLEDEKSELIVKHLFSHEQPQKKALPLLGRANSKESL